MTEMGIMMSSTTFVAMERTPSMRSASSCDMKAIDDELRRIGIAVSMSSSSSAILVVTSLSNREVR